MEEHKLYQKIKALEADYLLSNRELLISQVEINRLTAELAKLNKQLHDEDDVIKSEVVRLRVTEAEKALIQQKANEAGKTMSDYIRGLILD